MAHALLSPSSAHRWMSCPGSVSLSRLFPDESSSYAEEGTLAHAWAAHLLDPQNQPQPAEALSSDNLTFVQDYVLFVERETAGGVCRIEYPVSVSEVTGEANAKGTIDCAALVNGTLKIIDLKFGKGVKVDAEHNTQLMIYAAGALPLFDVIDEVKDIELTIFQPRINNICSWKLTPAELEEFVNQAREPRSRSTTCAPIPCRSPHWSRLPMPADSAKLRRLALLFSRRQQRPVTSVRCSTKARTSRLFRKKL